MDPSPPILPADAPSHRDDGSAVEGGRTLPQLLHHHDLLVAKRACGTGCSRAATPLFIGFKPFTRWAMAVAYRQFACVSPKSSAHTSVLTTSAFAISAVA